MPLHGERTKGTRPGAARETAQRERNGDRGSPNGRSLNPRHDTNDVCPSPPRCAYDPNPGLLRSLGAGVPTPTASPAALTLIEGETA